MSTILLNAQEISSLDIYPENPSNSDEILLIISTEFPFLDCKLDSVIMYYACGAFSFDGFYSTGFETGDCTRTDTVSLGVLPNGPYMISYRMYYLGWAQVDQADTFISVGAVGLEHLTIKQSSIIKIWPNPSHGQINLSIEDEKIDMIRISNMSGTYARNIDIFEKPGDKLRTLSLSAGTYVCTVFSNKELLYTSKFIVFE